ncbi:transcription termination factor Rho [Cerasicoccus arenae]|nr:transcription termination factor Rho [Cerasicoccus arenae]
MDDYGDRAWRSERQAEQETESRQEKPREARHDKNDGDDNEPRQNARTDREDRAPRNEDGAPRNEDRGSRNEDRPAREGRSNRGQGRNQRDERDERDNDSDDRGDGRDNRPQGQRQDNRQNRNDRGDRNDRNDRSDRNDRGGRNDRGDQNRGQHPHQKGNRQQHQQGGGGQGGNQGNRFDKNKKFKKKDRFGNSGPGGPPFQKRKGGWQKDFEAANEDDVDPPSFDSLAEWDIFRDTDALTKLTEEVTTGEVLDYNEIYALKVPEMEKWAKENGVSTEGPPSRRKLLRAILDHAGAEKRTIKATGIVEELEDGFGFLVFAQDSYRLRTESAFIAAPLFNKYGLQRGHEVEVILHAPREDDTTPFVLKVETVMGMDPENALHLTPFKELVPYYPTERIIMESEQGRLGKWDNISMRIVDLLSPIGLGQRGLIVAPPRTGKTVLLQGIANAIRVNKPDVKLIVLLVDERPEEVTDFKRTVQGAEVISSTFDESAESHVHAAEMVSEKARRMVEAGKDVIILLDSITRLARAYNTMMPSSGKILSGGVEASALQKPKRFFGSARNIEDGGSLTILGTALVETGSKMDEVIFEEFKGTGNMELHLDRELSNKRVFPALSFEKSGTRKEELLYHPDEMQKVYGLRRAMKGVGSVEAMEMLIQRVKKTQTNAQFLMSLR